MCVLKINFLFFSILFDVLFLNLRFFNSEFFRGKWGFWYFVFDILKMYWIYYYDDLSGIYEVVGEEISF